MLSPEELQAANQAKVNAIFERFNPVEPEVIKDNLVKSETSKETFWTKEGLSKYKEDLFKAVDEGTFTQEDFDKAEQELLSLTKVEKEIDGKVQTIFIKKD